MEEHPGPEQRRIPESFAADLLLVCMTPAILALLLFLTTLVPSALAADSKSPAPKAGSTQTNAQTSAQQDKFVEATIRAKLAKSKIGKDGFTVRVQGGVAYWEGTTTVPQHKGAATRMAHTSGAPNVINNIRVTRSGVEPSAARTASPPASSSPSALSTASSTASSTTTATKRPTAAPVPAISSTTNNTSPAAGAVSAPSTTPDQGPRRVQVKPASSTNGPPQ